MRFSMPLYSYYCEKCNEIYENLRTVKQRDIKLVCPKCNERCDRILDMSSFQLKGGGWAKDGYGNKKSVKEESS